jgi:ABC-type multidrug transport system fused ATPase/permease subunit
VVYELLRERGKNKYKRTEVIGVIRKNILSLNKPETTTELEEEIKHFIYKSSVKLNEIDTTAISLTLTNLNLLQHNKKPVASDTYRLRKQAFGQVLDHAYRNQYISENPMKRVKMTRKVDSTEIDPKTVLSPERCREIVIAVSNLPGNKNVIKNAQTISKALSVIWLAGLRPSEVVALQKKHLNFSEEGKTLDNIEGHVQLKDVTFAYPQRSEHNVYKSINLNIEAGQTVALVGPSGCGKSTAVQLIERFYDPADGSVLLDGVDIKTLRLSWLRQQIGLVRGLYI